MKYSNLFVLMAVVLAIACQSKKDASENTQTTEPETSSVTLTKKWETDPVLTTCESVIYDAENDILYVSNINGSPDAKDGNGFISKVTLDGQVMEAEWVKGLDAPKGMGISNGKLYVTDIDKIVAIDIASGNVSNSFPVSGASFLNDITVDSNGTVYASDSNAGIIAQVKDDQVSVWLDSLQGPNGLFVEENRMLMASWAGKTLNTVDLSTMEVSLRTDGIENPDGIEAIGDGSYLVSSWHGLVHHVNADWEKKLILDTSADSINAADIEYVQDKNLLLIPTFFKNTVVAYEVSK